MSLDARLSQGPIPTKEFCQLLMNEVKERHARLHHPFYWAVYDGSPRPVADHRALFLRFGNAIGIPKGELERCETEDDFLPTTVLARTGCLDIALRSGSIFEQV